MEKTPESSKSKDSYLAGPLNAQREEIQQLKNVVDKLSNSQIADRNQIHTLINDLTETKKIVYFLSSELKAKESWSRWLKENFLTCILLFVTTVSVAAAIRFSVLNYQLDLQAESSQIGYVTSINNFQNTTNFQRNDITDCF